MYFQKASLLHRYKQNGLQPLNTIEKLCRFGDGTVIEAVCNESL